MTDPVEDRDFIWYIKGCERLGWTPLDAEDFWPQYQRYRHNHRFLQAWETYRAQNAGLVVWLQSLTLRHSQRRMTRERDQLGHLGSAVAAGRYGFGDGDTIPAASGPRPVSPVSQTRQSFPS